MAVRHIRDYFDTMANQYFQLQQEVKEFEEEASKGLCDPDKVEQLKELLQPVKNNYLTLSYIMYLLNMPNRESKKKKYEIQNEKLLNSIPYENRRKGKEEENSKALKEIKKLND